MALDTGCPVVFPLYKLAPVGSAHQCVQGGLKLLLNIGQDSRFQDHRIIVTGASAGAWIALRIVLALAETVLGKSTARSVDSRGVVERMMDMSLTEHMDEVTGLKIARRISEVVLQSPWVDTDLSHPGDRYKDSKVRT